MVCVSRKRENSNFVLKFIIFFWYSNIIVEKLSSQIYILLKRNDNNIEDFKICFTVQIYLRFDAIPAKCGIFLIQYIFVESLPLVFHNSMFVDYSFHLRLPSECANKDIRNLFKYLI